MPLTKKQKTEMFTKVETMVAELQDLVVEFQTHMDAHSEKWQESDAGQAWQGYIEHIEQAIAIGRRARRHVAPTNHTPWAIPGPQGARRWRRMESLLLD